MDVRDFCLGLEGATETFPFGPETPVMKAANGKVFAVLSDPTAAVQTVSTKIDPEDSIALRQQYPSIAPGYHMNKRHWITVTLDGSVPDDLLAEIVAESHRLVQPKSRGAR